jgi:hypothetical protein
VSDQNNPKSSSEGTEDVKGFGDSAAMPMPQPAPVPVYREYDKKEEYAATDQPPAERVPPGVDDGSGVATDKEDVAGFAIPGGPDAPPMPILYDPKPVSGEPLPLIRQDEAATDQPSLDEDDGSGVKW